MGRSEDFRRITMRLSIALVLALFLGSPVSANPVGPAGQNPGLSLYHEAVRHYQNGNHAQAFEDYEESAHWGNKLSQFNLGTMYYNGVHVSRDPARAWAWVKLAAERGYQQLIDMEQAIWSELDATDRDRAERILERELLPEYGDAAALPRMERFVNRRYRSATGSRLGGVAGSNPVLVQPRDQVQATGDVYYRDDNWRVERWLEQEAAWFDAMMNAGEPVTGFEEQ
jgi:hypothetical protein